ncbi:beta-galactosidase [Acidovorax sp. 106]|uniref:beta-galactosidase n=1 Tax=Acidovorax sp. 106 TaxID=2135637 RepID=UPI000EB0634E|nr:beta-galactosidase [Acidovorax sp. 106]RLJ38456.1 beta-galactosidase-like protein [Acidovorax sp. 106]
MPITHPAAPDAARTPHPMSLIATTLGGLLAVTAGAGGMVLLHMHSGQGAPTRDPMLLAPMIGVIEPCILQTKTTALTGPVSATGHAPANALDTLGVSCSGVAGSAAPLVESTLSDLYPSGAPKPPRYPVGYTLPVPLLQLFEEKAGSWQLNQERIARLARTVRDTDRPVVVYLFATHFASHAPLEQALAQDPRNLAQTRDGAMPPGSYYGEPVYYWNIADPDAPVNLRRKEAASAMVQALCRLEPKQRAKIHAITLLGEVHHYFPDFETGMGFGMPYRVTDYSPISQQGFRRFLQNRFGRIEHLNRAVGGQFASFDNVLPPSKDIRTEPLAYFNEHIDSFAQGSLPVSGWAFAPGRDRSGSSLKALVYRNGVLAGKAPVSLSRQDVSQAKPEFGSVNTGWRVDLDFRTWPTGVHQLDIYLQRGDEPAFHLGSRRVAIMDRSQTTPQPQPMAGTLPTSTPLPSEWQAYMDGPAEQSSYYYNPLVPLWQAFRAQQVADYIENFGRQVVLPSCLAGTPTYTHQIIPFTNPSWDAQKFAVETSLAGLPTTGLGVSLYGEAAYGNSFAQWYAQRQATARPTAPGKPASQQANGYGVTEFHPLKPMTAKALMRTLDQHSQRGAKFLSFFMEPRWEGQRVERGHNIFSIDPQNPQFGSDVLYPAVQKALAGESR